MDRTMFYKKFPLSWNPTPQIWNLAKASGRACYDFSNLINKIRSQPIQLLYKSRFDLQLLYFEHKFDKKKLCM